MMRVFVAALAAAVLAAPPAGAEIQVSGLADFVGRNPGEPDVTNRNFRDTSNLDQTRVRLFLDAEVSEDAQIFTQLLISGYDDVFVYGAYLRLEELGDAPVNLQLGLIPTPVGTWAARTYSDRNPLVGVPLVYNHHTALQLFVPQTSMDALLAMRGERSDKGLPVLYDNCWNTGAELYGQVGRLDWSVGAVTGSQTLPQRSQVDKRPQVTGRMAWNASPRLSVGASGWFGPYLLEGFPLEYAAGQSYEDFDNGGFGGDLYASWRYLEVHSEVYRAFWEHPSLGTLRASSGYVEGKYKFLTRWYAAGRFGFVEPDRVLDSAGEKHPWDFPVHRVEYGVGYKVARRITTKLVVQHNRFDGADALAEDHYLMQISAGF